MLCSQVEYLRSPRYFLLLLLLLLSNEMRRIYSHFLCMQRISLLSFLLLLFFGWVAPRGFDFTFEKMMTEESDFEYPKKEREFDVNRMKIYLFLAYFQFATISQNACMLQSSGKEFFPFTHYLYSKLCDERRLCLCCTCSLSSLRKIQQTERTNVRGCCSWIFFYVFIFFVWYVS